MSDPFKSGPSDADKESEKQRDKAAKADQANIDAKDLQARQPGQKDSKSQDNPNLSKIDLQFGTSRSMTSFGYPIGQGPPFVLRKAEFLKPDHDKPVHELKNLISNFLNDTKLSDEHKLSNAELKEISSIQDRLSSAQSVPEAVQSALHLGKVYQEMKYLEEAKKARDLILGLDPNNQIGRQLFKELEKMHPQDLAAVARTAMAIPPDSGLSKQRLRARVNALSGGRVIVLGDLLIDELLEGRPERISREAPVLILEHVSTELILGGAANAAANLAALNGICHAIGVCGRDEYARKLARLFEKAGISHGLVEDPGRPTTVKTRILSSAHAMKQQLIRLDRISHELLPPEVAKKVLEKLESVAGSYSAVILSDYKSGLITDQLVAGALEIAQQKGIHVIVDAQNNFERFKGAALITPNQPDTEAALGFKIDSREKLEEAGKKMLALSGAKNVLLTRGGAGMVLFQDSNATFELPAFNRSEVFDVTGAGDTVVATMTLAMVTGASMTEAMALGNLAAGLVVKKVGTAVTSQSEILEALDNLKMQE